MAINKETLNKKLYRILSKYKPKPLDSDGKVTPVEDDADIFKFTFTDGGKEYGDVFASVDDDRDLILYYGDSVSESPMWLDFVKELKTWKNLNGFAGWQAKNTDQVQNDMARRAHMKKKDRIAENKKMDKSAKKDVAEGYYATGKKSSYSDAVPSVKIVIEHSRVIEEGEQRYRNINRIFLENQLGERYLLDTKKPGIARVYARHIAEGGKVNDDRWSHIGSLCEEYQKMAGFVRATRNSQFNESAQSLVNEGIAHYQSLRESLSRMTGKRGYNAYFESWTPSLMEAESEENNLNELFVQETLDPRIESVMPILSRIHKKVSESVVDKELGKLAEWADSLTEEESLTSNNPQGIPEEVEEGAYGRRGDAYERDIENSEYGMDRGRRDKAGLEMDAEEWFIVKDDGKMYKVSIFPTQRDAARNQGFSPSRAEAKAKAGSQGVAEGMNDWALKDKHTPRSIPRTSEKNNWSKKDIHNRAYDFPPTNYDKDGKDMYGQKKPELKSQAEGVAEGKEDKIKQLRQDYADKLRWSKEAHDPAQQRQHRIGASRIADHLKKQYGVDVEQGVAEGSDSDAYGNTGEKHECGSCDGTGIDTSDEVCPECGGKGWVRDKESSKKKGVAEGQLDELSPSTLGSYAKKANAARSHEPDDRKADNRGTGVMKSLDRIAGKKSGPLKGKAVTARWASATGAKDSNKSREKFEKSVDKASGVAEAAKWRSDDLEDKTWRSSDWDDGDLSPGKIKIDRSGKDVDDSGDELTSRPGAWRGKSDMAKRMTKKGVPTKSELGFQDNLKMRMRMKKKEGGLAGPKGVLPEQGVAEGSDSNTQSHADSFKSEIDTMKPGTKKYVGRKDGKEVHAKKDAQGNVKFYHRDGIKGPLKGVAEDLDADQKRAGQLGPTEKITKKNPLRGKLVGGANENFINTDVQAVVSEGQEDLDAILRIIRK